MNDDAYRVIEPWHGEIADYKDRVLAAARSSPLYSSDELRYDTRELVIFATGEPDNATAAVIGEAPSSIQVTWLRAPYTLQELIVEAQRLMAEHPILNSAGPLSDGTGLAVTTTDSELLSATNPRVALGGRYPISLSRGERATPC